VSRSFQSLGKSPLEESPATGSSGGSQSPLKGLHTRSPEHSAKPLRRWTGPSRSEQHVRTSGIIPEGERESSERDFDPEAASCMNRHEVPLTISCKSQTGSDIRGSQLGKISQDLLFGHARGQVGENIGNCDTHPTDTWLTATLSGLDRDDARVIHVLVLAQSRVIGKRPTPNEVLSL